MSANQSVFLGFRQFDLVRVPSIVTIPEPEKESVIRNTMLVNDISQPGAHKCDHRNKCSRRRVIAPMRDMAPLTVLDTHGPDVSVSFPRKQ